MKVSFDSAYHCLLFTYQTNSLLNAVKGNDNWLEKSGVQDIGDCIFSYSKLLTYCFITKSILTEMYFLSDGSHLYFFKRNVSLIGRAEGLYLTLIEK